MNAPDDDRMRPSEWFLVALLWAAWCGGRLLVLAFLIVVTLAAVSGCAMFEPSGRGLAWSRVRDPLPMIWVKVDSRADLLALCQQPSAWDGVACTNLPWHRLGRPGVAVVYSTLSETAARATWWHDGMTVWAHEKRHADGFDHAEMSVWSMTGAQGVVR